MPIIAISDLSKTYASIPSAEYRPQGSSGKIFALLGPNGAGKTTLIGIMCGIVTASAGRVTVDGRDIVTDYRAARALIGLVPAELYVRRVETVERG